MKPYTILLYVMLLLLFTVPSGATFVWPHNMGVQAFKTKLASWEGSVTSTERYWYEGKLFLIETESISYASVKIVRVITLSSNNIIIVFKYNGYTTYVPFNRIIKMYEVGK